MCINANRVGITKIISQYVNDGMTTCLKNILMVYFSPGNWDHWNTREYVSCTSDDYSLVSYYVGIGDYPTSYISTLKTAQMGDVNCKDSCDDDNE